MWVGPCASITFFAFSLACAIPIYEECYAEAKFPDFIRKFGFSQVLSPIYIWASSAWERKNFRMKSGNFTTPKHYGLMLRRSISSGFHPEKLLFHGIIVIKRYIWSWV
jgi:hypothetical protein